MMPSVITLKSTDGLAVGNVPARNIFLARVARQKIRAASASDFSFVMRFA